MGLAKRMDAPACPSALTAGWTRRVSIVLAGIASRDDCREDKKPKRSKLTKGLADTTVKSSPSRKRQSGLQTWLRASFD